MLNHLEKIANTLSTKENNIKTRHKVLLQAAVSYPRDDKFYRVLHDQLKSVEKEKADHFNAFIGKTHSLFYNPVA